MALPQAQADLFLRELEATQNVSEAARRAGLRQRQPLYTLRDRDFTFRAAWDKAMGREAAKPASTERIPVEQLTPEQRRAARHLLDLLKEDPAGSAQERARAALDAWLQRRPWPSLTAVVLDELKRISPRAYDAYVAANPTYACETPPAAG